MHFPNLHTKIAQKHDKITDNVTATIRYNFDAPIYQTKEENDEDLELS